MTVKMVPDQNFSSGYALRWEHGPVNRDRALPQPWPAPTMLSIVKLNSDREQYLSGNIAAGKPVTASSSHEIDGWGKTSLVDGELRCSLRPIGGSSGEVEVFSKHRDTLVGAPLLEVLRHRRLPLSVDRGPSHL